MGPLASSFSTGSLIQPLIITLKTHRQQTVELTRMRPVSSPSRVQLNCLLPSFYGNELRLVCIVALLHKYIVTSAYIVARVVETSCFHCCADLSRCYGILVCHSILEGSSEDRWEHKIKIDLNDLGCECVYWTHASDLRLSRLRLWRLLSSGRWKL
jgi:hypothetical protein